MRKGERERRDLMLQLDYFVQENLSDRIQSIGAYHKLDRRCPILHTR
jgi:hypothetical protein